jgi:hypothetical protein
MSAKKLRKIERIYHSNSSTPDIAATLSVTPSALDDDLIDFILIALTLILIRIRARSRQHELQRRVIKRLLYIRGARKQRPYRPLIRYKKMYGRERVWMSGRFSNSRDLKPYLLILTVIIIVLIMEIIDFKKARSCVLCLTLNSTTSHADLGFNVILLKPFISLYSASRDQIAISKRRKSLAIFQPFCRRFSTT